MSLAVTQLAGFAAAVAGVASVTQVTQAFADGSNTAGRATWPTVQPGDVAFLLEVIVNAFGAPPAAAVPTGFVQLLTATLGGSAQDRAVASVKLCDGSETGTIVGMTVGTFTASTQLLVVFRGNIPITGIAAADGASEANNGDPADQTCNASAGPAPLIVIGMYSTNGTIDPRTFTVGGVGAKDGEYSGGLVDRYIAWKIYNSSPQDVVIGMEDEGTSNILMSFYLSVS